MVKHFHKGAVIILFVAALAYTGFVTEAWHPHEHHDHSDEYHADSHREAFEVPKRLLFPTREPDRVILNLGEDAGTSMAVNWRSDTTVMAGFLEYAIATAGPEFTATVTRVSANMEALTTKHMDEPTINAHYFSALLTGLKGGETYVYRVGTEGAWSEWYQIRMPDVNSGRLSFIYFGDAQNDLKSMWSRVIREAYRTIQRADFMLHAGDLINRYDRDLEWGEWFYAGSFIHATVPSVMTPGNHEYGKGVILSPQWRPQFHLPRNGPAGLEETCYVVNFPNLKVISLDAEQIDESPYFLEKQAVWLDSVLSNDPRKWTAITFHYPVFSTSPNRDNEKLRLRFKPIFDKYKVDIILQGHDHAYGRGMVNNVPTGYSLNDKESGTMYVVSVSGPKMYDISKDAWMDRKARNTQLFQIISIDGDVLTFQSFTARGELYDAFELHKRKGKPNKLVNRIPDVPERL